MGHYLYVLLVIYFAFSYVIYTQADEELLKRQRNYTSYDQSVTTTLKSSIKLCRYLAKTYDVKPGVSWGTLSKPQQDKWMSVNCDQYFCKPNTMAGKGVYRCIPLTRKEKLDNE